MICEVREGGKEIVLRHVTLSDVFAFMWVMVTKKEIAFTRPEDTTDEDEG